MFIDHFETLFAGQISNSKVAWRPRTELPRTIEGCVAVGVGGALSVS